MNADDDPSAGDNGPGNEEETAHEGRKHEYAVQEDVEEAAEDAPPWTMERRRRHYDMRATYSLRLLAALGGLAVIGAGDLAGQNLGVGPCSHGWCAVPWPATVVTFFLATGASLGWSWSSFSHAARVLEVEIGGRDNKGNEEWLAGRTHDPTGAETVYRIGTILMALSGLVLLAGFWSMALK
jgi:hypothetical protein